MADTSDLPVLRDKIESGQCHQDEVLPASDLAYEFKVSIRVAYSALTMLAANWYVSHPGAFTSYSTIWSAGT